MKTALFPCLITSLCALIQPLQGGEIETLLDGSAWELGDPPRADVFVVDGEIQVTEEEGDKRLTIEPAPIVDANAQLGTSAKGSASIEVRVWAAKRARSYPRIGVGVHGISGYRLIVNAPRKQIELIIDDEVVATAPFAWEDQSWTHVRLAAQRPDSEDGQWTITGSAWADGAEAPAEPMITHLDETDIRGSGKGSIWGTPYSEQPIHFDDIRLKVEVEDEE